MQRGQGYLTTRQSSYGCGRWKKPPEGVASPTQRHRNGLTVFFLKERHFTEDEKGEILLFKEPEQGRPYTLGGDTAGEGSDSFTVQVIDNITGEQMARLKWQRCDEDTYAKQVYCLGRYYNDALAAVETNFPRIRRRCWNTYITRSFMCGRFTTTTRAGCGKALASKRTG